MPTLVFLTGAPGSGKSTLARLLVDERPLALLLEVDALRAQLGGWRRDPAAAGLRARRLALEAALVQLQAGGDVVVPQFVRRPELVQQFRELAARTGSRFVLVALVSSPEEAEARFAARTGSDDPLHEDAAFLQGAPGAEPVSALYTTMLDMLRGFPEARFVESTTGDIPGTLERLQAAVED